MDLDAIRSLGTQPIAGGAPAGESVRYETEFEQLSAEIEKLTAVEQVAVDWRVVVNLSSGLLKDKGKDLLVASYLSTGLLEREGYAGLAAGISVVNGLVDNFWEGLFPEARRLRARVSAIDWMSARLEKALETRGDPGLNEREALEQCIEGLSKILSDQANHFEGNAPNIGPARRGLKAKLETIPLPEPEPTPEPAATAEAAPAEAAAPPPPPPEPEPEPADTPETVKEALGKFRQEQVEYAVILREADNADPGSYLLVREAMWSESTLEDIQSKSTGEASALKELEKDLEAGEFENVIAQTENLIKDHPLWLDLQLMTARALEGLGLRYARAHNAVIGSLQFLLHRVPDLPTTKNGKKAAFASAAAKVWITNEVLANSEPSDGDEAASVSKDARKLVARKKLKDAIGLLSKQLAITTSRRGRFMLRLDLVQLCIEAGKMEFAFPQLEQLEQEITQFSLEEWEPELATNVIHCLMQCSSGAKPAPALAERSKEIYARLCRLDPAAAVTTQGPTGD